MDTGKKVFSASVGVCTIRINKPFLAISSHAKKGRKWGNRPKKYFIVSLNALIKCHIMAAKRAATV
jgi:hypothetical protein